LQDLVHAGHSPDPAAQDSALEAQDFALESQRFVLNGQHLVLEAQDLISAGLRGLESWNFSRSCFLKIPAGPVFSCP
jgi:hypothetical protein